jgi:lactate dehydrogenase-like 2-hydroxyacid dehydrogenase
VDEQALGAALKSGRIRTTELGADGDEPRVPCEPIDLEHVMLSTQTALGSVHTRNAIGQAVTDILMAWASSR